MRVLVCGSRSGFAYSDLQALFDRLLALPADTIVIHGDARGVDRYAGACADMFGLRVIAMPADWHTYGRAAGVIRNVAMLDMSPDLVIAFWNGVSRGTKHTMDEAERRGIPVEVLP